MGGGGPLPPPSCSRPVAHSRARESARFIGFEVMSSEGKVAVITGGGTGIGKAAALALAGDGWRVAITGRRLAPLQAVATEAGANSKNVLPVQGDVSDPKSVHVLFTKVVETFGRVDLLFNNAGINAPGVPLENLAFDQWQNVVNTNLTGVFLCSQEAVRIMKQQNPRGGRIINNGSIAAHTPRPNTIAYTATKHAVTGITKSIALDGRAFDIACGQIDIGNAGTELASAMPRSGPNAEPLMDVGHVGRAVLQMANLPLDANVLFMTIMATKMPYVGRG
jgi:NAD(P)-dependent dehydrogenase (short-subunit alcohol dehydrogenase family)